MGGTIKGRDYFLKCFKSIINVLEIKWLKIGEFTKGKAGHSRHPSRGFYSDLIVFGIAAFIKSYNEKIKTSSLL